MRENGHKNRTARLVLLVVLVTVAFLSVASVSAVADGTGVEVSVEYDGEPVEDGEKVEVNQTEVSVDVLVESEKEINSVYAELHNTTVGRGVGNYSYNVTHVLTTEVGPNIYTVRATDVEGNAETHTVNFYREPVTVPELHEAIERLEERERELEEEIEELKEKRDELRQERDETLTMVNGTDDSTEEEGGDAGGVPASASEGEGLPGFTFIGALFAFALVVAGVARPS